MKILLSIFFALFLLACNDSGRTKDGSDKGDIPGGDTSEKTKNY